MATPARKRNPHRPYQVVFRHTKAAPLPPEVEALVLDAQLSFCYTTGLQDGTRSEQIATWSRVLAAAVTRAAA
jgi:hypothetical protein